MLRKLWDETTGAAKLLAVALVLAGASGWQFATGGEGGGGAAFFAALCAYEAWKKQRGE